MTKILIYILILILCLYFYIFNVNYIENFDASKITISEFAHARMAEFNYNYYKSYIDKYFNELNIINLKNIPVGNNDLIFCSIAAYRDKQCSLTVQDMIAKALYPENLVICICQQNNINDNFDCFTNYDLKGATIKKILLSDKDARGPCWARFLIQQQWTGEKYFLQIDSHMRFEYKWDEKCINELNLLPDKSCLTNYVSNYNLDSGLPDEYNKLRGPLKIQNKETSDYDGFFRINSEFIDYLDKPILAYGWAACFSFSKANLLHDAPYDPYTQFLFFGEEMDIWARMYTHGWHVYAPSIPICYTSFDRGYRPTFWEHPDQMATEFLCRLRLYYKFKYLNDIPYELKIKIDDYALGTQKTWNEFLIFCLDELDYIQ